MIGNWTVKDEIGGKIIGISTIGFLPDGEIQIYNNNNNPNSSFPSSTTTTNTGLRWRLDAGPTHLDTVTFQVVSSNINAFYILPEKRRYIPFTIFSILRII